MSKCVVGIYLKLDESIANRGDCVASADSGSQSATVEPCTNAFERVNVSRADCLLRQVSVHGRAESGGGSVRYCRTDHSELDAG